MRKRECLWGKVGVQQVRGEEEHLWGGVGVQRGSR